ncbi:hypothetical protein FisN_20Lh163 [Fistulifera solaris]|uniref:Uncharacterized protein n=1 Tax=Fistulifera solaris TaxID=1519565 RepID=A0A1Z5KRZ0_FISSO|nr:hypothetical protein FisN_20Lh163 [Fistulifera solaris]|eukprot:GAX28862.1 hypothetical protein FisN_20Lh163 [Fistulifera solaris]
MNTDEPSSFAAALATALQENELKTPTPAELIHETYVKLCHDDPYDLNATGCELLAQELLKSETSYALSSRLVQGLDQVLRRPADTENSQTKLERGVSFLAWTVHVRIPWTCLNLICSPSSKSADEKLQRVKRYMGSYRGNHQFSNTADDDNLQQKMTQDLQIAEDHSKSTNETEQDNLHEVTAGAQQYTSSLEEEEEVWAAESDPDDFDFQSGYNYQDELQGIQEWAALAVIDPHSLSLAPDDTSWSEIAVGIVSLLTPVRYSSHLASLSNQDWKGSWESCWVPLILSLLVLPDQNVDCPLWIMSTNHRSGFQRLGFHLMQIIRDAVSHRPDVLLTPYIELLQNLLLVQTTQSELATRVLPAAWVGLGSLSALCDSTLAMGTNQASTLPIVQKGIIESCEQLTSLLERSQGDAETYCSVQWSYLSLMRALAVDPVSTIPAMGSAHGQLLLQSGLFRQWLLHWMSEKSRDEAEVVHLRRLVHRALWDLCAASPNLLGKYAWRFPDVAVTVTKETKENSVNTLLWNLLGILLSKSDAPKLKLRNSVLAEPPSTAECQSTAWLAFQSLCRSIESILLRWRKKVERAASESDSLNEALKKDIHMVKEFETFVGVIAKSQLTCQLFLEEMVPVVDGKHSLAILKSCLHPLKEALQDWPAQNAGSVCDKGSNDDNSDDEKDGSIRKRKHALPIQEVRNCIKTLSTIFLSHGEGARSSSKSD